MRLGDCVLRVWDLDRGFDFSHDGVDRGMEAEGFFDDLGIKGEALQGIVSNGGEIFAEYCTLFLQEFLGDFRARGEPENYPRDC